MIVLYILCQTLSISQYFPQFSFYSVLSWNLAVIKSCTKRVSCRSLGSRNNPLNRSAALRCVRTSISGYYFFDGDSAGEQRLKGRPYAVPWSRYRLREGDVASLPAEYYFLIRFQPFLLAATLGGPSANVRPPILRSLLCVSLLPLNLVNASKMLRSPGNGDAVGMVLQCLRIWRNPEADEE